MIHRRELAKAWRAVEQFVEGLPPETVAHITVSYYGESGSATAWVGGENVYRTKAHIVQKGGGDG